jgi:hypothetical protein
LGVELLVRLGSLFRLPILREMLDEN